MFTRIFGFLVFVSVAIGSRAQQPFPVASDVPHWNVLSCITGVGTSCHTSSIQFVGSLSMCSHSYSAFADPGGSPNDTSYVRNEGQRTWLRRGTDCSAKEYLLYDFSMGVGDTVYTGLNMDYVDPDTAMFILQNIDTVVFFGVERRRFTLMFDRCNEGIPNTPMEWIEGIGSTMHPFYPVECICDFCEQGLILLCYDRSGVQLYIDPIYQTCDTLITAIVEPVGTDANVINVIPGGTAGSICVTVAHDVFDARRTGLTLVLMASDGRIIRRQGLAASAANDLRLDVDSVAPGTYLVLLTDGRQRLAGQLVVVL